MSRQIKDPISGSWVNIAGYNAIDNALDSNSRNPVQNKIITEQFNAINTKVGELSNLDTTDKSNIVAAINELKNTVNTVGFASAVAKNSNRSFHCTLNTLIIITRQGFIQPVMLFIDPEGSVADILRNFSTYNISASYNNSTNEVTITNNNSVAVYISTLSFASTWIN